MHQKWLSLPLLSSCVSAFYPYQGGNKGGSNDKRFFPVQIDGPQKDGSRIHTVDVRRVQKRDNAFPVVTSSNPTQPNSMAIHQDGSDFSYFSTVNFGSKEKAMYMLIDTGSANTWVMGSSCSSASCKIHNSFGSADSDTLNATSKTWSLAYGTGEVSGVVARDKISFAGFEMEVGFGLATSASDDFNNYPMDGILGLGRPSSDELGTQTVTQVLNKRGDMTDNVIGIHLQRASDGTKDGQITFGGIDKSRFKGDISYTTTTNTAHWEIPVDDAAVNGVKANMTGKTAIVDTGTSYILMPPADATILHLLIPGSSNTGEKFVVPCGSTAEVQFIISGISYTISPKDYVGKASGGGCSSNIIGHQAFGPNQWILGDVFLKNVYAVFDFDKGRVGFGTMFGITVTSSSSTSSSSTSAGSTSPSLPSSSITSSPTSRPSSTGTSSGSATSSTSTKPSLSDAEESSNSTPRPTATSSSGESSPFEASTTTSIGAPRLLPFAWQLIFAFVVGLLL